jgi:hypothetical protein
MKKAFKDVTESNETNENDIAVLTVIQMLENEKREIEAERQKRLVEEVQKEIDEMNYVEKCSSENKSAKKSREDVLNDLLSHEDLSEEDALNDTLDDASDDDDDNDKTENVEPILLSDLEKYKNQNLSYVACVAHHWQLVLNDGLKLDENYQLLINKCSKDIVSKIKKSTIVSEELRLLDRFVTNKNATRWSSILFMVRSIQRIS